MAYQVLARKYRPQRFADVIGQQHATATLMNALTQGRVAHGYIFSGHRGIGKTTVARILAMALNCRRAIGDSSRPSAEPCGTCESCTEVRAGNSVDVIEIDAATNRGIDEIRELRDAARYRPARDRFKIYILDEAHQITDAAFNALLKTLEEPPEHIVFMMATTQPEAIPQTVRSRAQHFSFRAVSFSDLVRELRLIADREQIDASDAVLNLIAEAGDGSVRDALSVLDQAIASALTNSGEQPVLDVAQVGDMLGSLAGVVFERMLGSVNEGRSADLISSLGELIDAGNNPVQIARQLVRYLRNCILAKISGLSPDAGEGSHLLQMSLDEQRRAARSAAAFSEEELARFLQIMLRTFDEVGYRQEPRLHLELGLFKLLHLRRLLPIEELLSQLPAGAAPAALSHTSAIVAQAGNAVGSASSETAPRDGSKLRSRAVSTGLPTKGVSESGPGVPAETATSTARGAEGPAGEEFEAETALSAAISVPNQMSAKQPPAVDLEAASGEPDASPQGLSDPPVPASSGPGQTSQSENQSAVESPNLLEDVQATVLDALRGTKGLSSAADALMDADWSITDDKVLVNTTLSKKMLGVLLTLEAQKIIGSALLRRLGKQIAFEAVPGLENSDRRSAPSSPRATRAGSAESRAHGHPIVQEAQRLFNAEIRNVIDLSTTK